MNTFDKKCYLIGISCIKKKNKCRKMPISLAFTATLIYKFLLFKKIVTLKLNKHIAHFKQGGWTANFFMIFDNHISNGCDFSEISKYYWWPQSYLKGETFTSFSSLTPCWAFGIEINSWGCKGQLSSNGVLMSSISSKKRMKEFDFTTMIPQIDLFSFVFWRKSKTPKNHFEIIWPLI